jgi:hypothetical protein
MSIPAPPFIDAAYAADMLHVPIDTVLDWVATGKLSPYGGRAGNPFLRSRDVMAVAEQLGIGEQEPETPKRVKSGSARVQQRLTADARWSDVSDDDIRDWAKRADDTRRAAARKAATSALERLQTVLRVLDEGW